MVDPFLNQVFAASNFILETTNDGSPTLRHSTSKESMHHFDGAASETWFVYGSVLKSALDHVVEKNLSSFKVASIGLGLGYIELSWALIVNPLLNKKHKLALSLDSFEISDQLRNAFLHWINMEASESKFIYDKALLQLQTASQMQRDSTAAIKKVIKQPTVNFHGDLLKIKEPRRWNFICFDAFSKNTDAHLWTEDYLDNFLNQHADQDSVFTTYAATSVLKKVLVKNNFKLLRRLGYSGKRECTLAVRGQFMDGFATYQTF